jgi:hypothetical protein
VENMSQEYKVEPYTIILFLFGVSFLIAAGSTAEAQEGAHEHQSLERKIQSLTERIDALEAAQQQPSAASAPPAASPPQSPPSQNAQQRAQERNRITRGNLLRLASRISSTVLRGAAHRPGVIMRNMAYSCGIRVSGKDFTPSLLESKADARFARCFCKSRSFGAVQRDLGGTCNPFR